MTTRFVRRLVFEGTLHRFLWSLDRVESFDRPAVERRHRAAQAARYGDRAERPPSLTDRDHALRGGHDQRVSRLAHSCRQRDRQVRICSIAIRAWKYSDDGAAGARCTFAGRARDAAEAAVDDDRARFREQPADLARRIELTGRRLRGAAHGDISAVHRAKSLVGSIGWDTSERRSTPLGQRRGGGSLDIPNRGANRLVCQPGALEDVSL